MHSLNEKNASIMSAFSFAYRSDRSPHDAVHMMSNEFKKPGRLFVAEYDFSKFFDTIDHEALWSVADERGVLLTSLERHVVSRFLTSRSTPLLGYDRKAGTPRNRGIPQGNSISLFAANMSALNMDRSVERTGVGYARYADDTVMWAAEYDRLISGIEALRKEGARIGARFNVAKSPGVRIFAQANESVEFTATPTVNYIGYSFSRSRTSMREGATARIKARCNNLVWTNLLSSIRPFHLDARRIAGNIDRDYVVLIFQLRRYIYGGMSEQKLQRILSGKALRVHYPGVMSYFPLVDDLRQLQELDGWLLSTIQMALKKRIKAIDYHGLTYPAVPTPDSEQLLTLITRSTGGNKLDLRIPSFARIGTAVLDAARAYGASAVSKSAKGNDYLYEFV